MTETKHVLANERGPWLMMPSGRRWYILDPRPEEIYWPDVAEMLSKIPRFNGATPGVFVPVAQHLNWSHDYVLLGVPEIAAGSRGVRDWVKLAALLHDGHEHIVNDRATPVKKAIEIVGGGPDGAYNHIRELQDRAIYTAVGLPYPLPQYIKDAVKWVDAKQLVTEARDFMHSPEVCTLEGANARGFVHKLQAGRYLTWKNAMHGFLRRLRELGVEWE